MDKINRTPPYSPGDRILKKEVKGLSSSIETQASTSAASAAQASEAAVRNFLIQQFGDTVGNDAFSAISEELKKGKKLSFDMVKKALMDAAEKDGKQVDPKKLEGLKSLFRKTEPVKVDDNPWKAFLDLIAFQDMARAQSAKMQSEHEDRLIDAEVKHDIEQKAEVKEQQMKKLLDPKKKV